MYIIIERNFDNTIKYLLGGNAFINKISPDYKITAFRIRKQAEHKKMMLELYEDRFRLEICDATEMNLPPHSTRIAREKDKITYDEPRENKE
jgi:hypothetical protein